MSKARGILYLIARILGDLEALFGGKAGKRVARRGVGKVTGKGIGKLFK